MKLTDQEKRKIRAEVNALARAIYLGDQEAKYKLRSLIQTNPYVASLLKSARRKADKEAARSGGRKRKGPRMQGGVMHGLASKTGARNWKTTK